MVRVSVIIPMHNESKILKKNTDILASYLKNSKNFDNYEILLCDNGSTDSSLEIAKSSAKKNKKIRVFSVQKKGIGLGIKLGIKNANYDICLFYAADLPFGLNVISDSWKCMKNKNADMVIGSKEHKRSIRIKHDLKRVIFSRTYNYLINFVFKIKIRDTQGSIMFRKSNINKFLSLLDSPSAFFETQIISYSILFGARVIEIPVNYAKPRKDSKINCMKDGWIMLKELIKEYKRFKKIKKIKS